MFKVSYWPTPVPPLRAPTAQSLHLYIAPLLLATQAAVSFKQKPPLALIHKALTAIIFDSPITTIGR